MVFVRSKETLSFFIKIWKPYLNNNNKDYLVYSELDKDIKIKFKTFEEDCRTKSPILMAYYGGNFFEGTDFKDEKSRLIILIGIPFPSRHDP